MLVFTGYRLLTLLALPHARAIWGATFLFFSLNGPFFLDRFLTAGPFVLALVYMLLFLMATVATLGENRLRWNLLAFLAGLGMLLFHGGVGIMVLVVTFISIPVVWIAGRLNPFRGPGWELTGTVLPMVLALLVGAPYLAHILRAGPFDPALFLRISPGKVASVVRRASSRARLRGRSARPISSPRPRCAGRRGRCGRCFSSRSVWSWSSRGRTRCSGRSPSPMCRSRWPRAPPCRSSGRARAACGRALFAIALVLVLVPRTALGVAAYLGAPPPPAFAPEARETVAWLREHTPADAVVADIAPDLSLAGVP